MRHTEIGLLLSEPGACGRAKAPREPAAGRLRALVELAVRAEQLGFDSIWLDGETPDADGLRATPVLLAAIAARTTRLRLGAGLALSAGLDPLRIAEDFATLDGLSSGRIELVVSARGFAAPSDRAPAVTEASRDCLRETATLLRRLWTETDVCWSGRIRGPLERVTVHPRPVQQPHPPLWIGSGGDPQAGALAAALGMPILSACGTRPAPADRAGLCHVVSFEDRDPGCTPPGALCGSAAEVAEHLLAARSALGIDVQLVCLDGTGRADSMASDPLERFGRDVLPLLRKR
jgi:alkanesulfonate monooxygenase SsuD/methylene tetrahydromethanopterin reductase-like flavin-dependent oxidoreductase (luciferase family)